jgi:hypothetical protein
LLRESLNLPMCEVGIQQPFDGFSCSVVSLFSHCTDLRASPGLVNSWAKL